MCKFILLILALFHCDFASAQKAVSAEIQNLKSAGFHFNYVNLLNYQTNDLESREYNLKGLKKGTIINLDKNVIQHLLQNQSDFISIPVPLTNRTTIVLTLKRHELFAEDFKLFTSSDPAHAFEYTPGIHYRGIVEDDPSSIVAFSVFQDHVMAMIATDKGNFVIGQIKGDSQNRHIYYNDKDLEGGFTFECNTADDGIGYTEDQLKPVNSNRDVGDCVRIHVVIDDDIVIQKGGVTPAVNYITGLFNQSFLLYANEEISLTISEIFAWTTPSPYNFPNSSGMLSSFQANTEFFNGDLSHLVSFGACCGVAAGGDNLCAPSPDASKCFSHIDPTYEDVPVYSWPVFVVTHEMGHLLGSAHTHACAWNGNNTAIDGCYESEGSCPNPPIPPNGGTIMSYCYAAGSGSFVNLNHGFGPQPGNVIRNEVNESSNCITPCGTPVDYCSANGANSSTEFIDKIVLGSINNLSGNNGGYEDFTNISTTLTAGTTYTITLTPKFTGGNKTKSWRVWIDYNNDLDWYDDNEIVAQGAGSNTINLTFSIPANSISYTTRMRIAMKYPGYTSFCGTFPVGEVEDYTVIISGLPQPTCSDSIQNQNETGVDCGGPCPACPPGCNDGILNQDETGIDCGGVCPPCATCTDGIQNQYETGIDCGGPCMPCPVDSTVLLGAFFETDMDSWLDGGSDVTRVNSANSYEGVYSIMLADNSGAQSAMTSPAFNVSDAVGLQIKFHFYAFSMETNERFFVMYKNGSGAWTTMATFYSGVQFNNNIFYSVTVPVQNFVPTTSASFRIQCDASDNNDQVFIDAVIITKLTGSELIEDNVQVKEISDHQSNPTSQIILYPNPASDLLYIKSDQKIDHITIVNANGQEVRIKISGETTTNIDISALNAGIYFVFIRSGNQLITSRFVKL